MQSLILYRGEGSIIACRPGSGVFLYCRSPRSHARSRWSSCEGRHVPPSSWQVVFVRCERRGCAYTKNVGDVICSLLKWFHRLSVFQIRLAVGLLSFPYLDLLRLCANFFPELSAHCSIGLCVLFHKCPMRNEFSDSFCSRQLRSNRTVFVRFGAASCSCSGYDRSFQWYWYIVSHYSLHRSYILGFAHQHEVRLLRNPGLSTFGFFAVLAGSSKSMTTILTFLAHPAFRWICVTSGKQEFTLASF